MLSGCFPHPQLYMLYETSTRHALTISSLLHGNQTLQEGGRTYSKTKGDVLGGDVLSQVSSLFLQRSKKQPSVYSYYEAVWASGQRKGLGLRGP